MPTTRPTNPTIPPVRTRRTIAVALVASTALLLAGCSDDDPQVASSTTADAAVDDPAPTTDEPAGDLTAFCEVAEALNDQESLPTTDQLAEYQALAPDEIAEPVEVLVAAFEAAGDSPQAVFSNPEAIAAIEELTAFEADACGLEPPGDPGSNEIDPAATRVEVTATDHAFDVDLPTSPGRYSFVMANTGAEPHLMVVAHLEDDADLAEVLATEGEAGGVITALESDITPPGSEGVVTGDLAPGRWVILCPIPTADGTSHVDLGMIEEFTVS